MTKQMMKTFFYSIVFSGVLFLGLTNQVLAADCGGATACVCGDTVISSYTLTGNLTCTGHGLVVGAADITIDGNNFTITGDRGSSDYGINNASGYDNITIQNFTNITNFGKGIYLVNSTGSIIQNNTANSNNTNGIYLSGSNTNTLTSNIVNSNTQDGIYFTSSDSNTLTSNTANLNLYGITLAASSDSNTLTSNTANSNTDIGIIVHSSDSNILTSNTANLNKGYGIYLVSADTNTLTSNITNSNTDYAIYLGTANTNVLTNNVIANNKDTIYDDGTNTYSGNQLLYNLTATPMLTFTEVTRTKSLNDTVSFDISLLDIDGVACSDCSYTITTSPSETVSSSKSDNDVTGSFTVTKSGVYSLIFTITDSDNNVTKRNYLFFVDASGSQTTKYYLRGTEPTHGQPAASDAKSLQLTAPTRTEAWDCFWWIQNSPDTIPDYPLAYLSSINTYSWYKTDEEGYIGIQRFATASDVVEASSTVAIAADYTWVQKDLTGLTWAMDYPISWYWLSLKLYGLFPTWQTTVAQPSYANFNYSYAVTPIIKSISNTEVVVLSATAPSTDHANITLTNPYATATSTTLTLIDFQRPFLNSTSTIYSNATTTMEASLSGYATSTFSTVTMDLTPSAGSVEIEITTWNTSDTYSKEWTETGSASDITVDHVIGDLKADTYYTVNVDGTRFNTYLSNGSGQLTLTYNGGYSTKTFTVAEDTTAPTGTAISTITADSTSQLTVSGTTVVDSESGLPATPYWFQETSGHSGGSSSVAYQDTTSFVDNGLAANTQYTYQVKTQDLAGNVSDYSTAVSKYTLAPTPTSLDISSYSSAAVNLSATALNNSTSGSSGYYFSRSDGVNSGWIQTNTWQDTNAFVCGANYTYTVKYRNGDGVETSSVSSTAVIPASYCGGGMLPGLPIANTIDGYLVLPDDQDGYLTKELATNIFTKIKIPKGLFEGTAVVTIKKLTIDQINQVAKIPLPNNREIINPLIADYSIMLENQEITNFNNPVNIKFNYHDEDISNYKEDSLKIYYFDEISKEWSPLLNNTIDTFNNIVEADAFHFSIIAVLGELKSTVAEPTIIDKNILPENIIKTELRYGDNNGEVIKLQDILKELGFFPRGTPSTGWFGPITLRAVNDYQSQVMKITPCNCGVGPATLASLNANHPVLEPTLTLEFSQDLKYNDQGLEVNKLQNKLKELGFFPAFIKTTFWFGPITEKSVTAFQEYYNLPLSGLVNEITRKILNSL